MSDIAIKVEQVSKKFSRSLKRTMLYGSTDLARSFFSIGQSSPQLRKGEFWALDDISFKVKKGEAIGLVGGNGAGKSTILKLLNGIFMPDKGQITIDGRIGALIEVGAGFHPMLTGRENIYVNGTILGMSKAEIDRQLESIIDFAEIDDFIDAPVKHYSSGMFVRLGFAIAAHCRPDILLIDEVLAVGDARFQRKCLNHLMGLKKQGVTFILVSHSMQTIEAMTSTGILFDKGKMVQQGDPGGIIAEYELEMRSSVEGEDNNSYESQDSPDLRLIKRYENFGTNDVVVKYIRLLDCINISKKRFNSNESMVIEVFINSEKEIENVKLWLSFINDQNLNCLGTRLEINLKPGNQILRLKFDSIQLTTGVYKLTFHLFDETFSNPFSNGHYGYFKVVKNIPTLNPGVNTPVCWKDVVLERLEC